MAEWYAELHKQEAKRVVTLKWMMATVLVGNIVVGAAVVTALIVLKSGWVLAGLLTLPSLWAKITIGK